MQVPMAHWTLCMVLLLAGLPGAEPQARYQNFLRKHVDHPRTALAAHRYCDRMIERRQVNRRWQPCRDTNTFVHAPEESLVAACNQRENAKGFKFTPTRLSITICRQQGRNNWPHCKYTGWQTQHFVEVQCMDGLPMHLEDTHP